MLNYYENKMGNLNFQPKSDYRECLKENVDYEIENEQFVSRSKGGVEGAFSRNRKLSLKTIIFLVIRFKSSIQRELDRFYKEMAPSDFNIREVTKGAFHRPGQS